MPRLLLLLAALAATLLSLRPAPAQPSATPPPPTLTAAALDADFQVLREVYETLHPGLYRSLSKEELEGCWAQLRRDLARDQSLADAYWAFSRFLATLRCGHSYCNFFNQGDEVEAALLTAPRRVPFHFRWIDGRMIVTLNRSADPRLSPGAEILAINGTPSHEIFARLMQVARADGPNDAKRARDIAIAGDAAYEAFDIFFPIAFPFRNTSFELRVKPSGGGDALTFATEGLTYEQRLETSAAAKKRHDSGEPVWECSMLDDQTALLRMPNWALYNTPWKWSEWLHARIDELVARNVPNLVVDLRGNEGGLDCGNELIARLIDHDIVFLEQLQRHVRYRKVPEHLNQYLRTWDKSFRDWGDAAKPAPTPQLVAAGGQEFFRLSRYDDDAKGTVISPRSPRYTARVFVLIDAVCSSATFQFAGMMKQNRLATLVGETTGGSQRGLNGGAFFFLTLPNSKIEIDVPLIATLPSGDGPLPPDAGIEPDVRIATRVEDITRGTDRAIEEVRRMIRERP